MERRRLIQLMIAHILFFSSGVCIFTLLFSLPILSTHSILFYRGILFILITVCILTLLMYFTQKAVLHSIWTVRDTILSLVLTMSFILVFFTHIPVTADRSISIFVLGYINANEQAVTKQAIQEDFIHTYVTTNDAMEKRLQEQLVTGTIQFDGNGYKITSKGKLLLWFYEKVARAFHIDMRLILHQ